MTYLSDITGPLLAHAFTVRFLDRHNNNDHILPFPRLYFSWSFPHVKMERELNEITVQNMVQFGIDFPLPGIVTTVSAARGSELELRVIEFGEVVKVSGQVLNDKAKRKYIFPTAVPLSPGNCRNFSAVTYSPLITP